MVNVKFIGQQQRIKRKCAQPRTAMIFLIMTKVKRVLYKNIGRLKILTNPDKPRLVHKLLVHPQPN